MLKLERTAGPTGEGRGLPIPERIETARLVLRQPVSCDADAIFSAWASDPVVTRYMSWPCHTAVADSRAFIEASGRAWCEQPAGPYVIGLRVTGRLIGSCGFTFSEDGSAEVGYVLARSEWNRGYATEALRAQVGASESEGPISMHAAVHPDNTASQRVLVKCGFTHDGKSAVLVPFPNLGNVRSCLALRYVFLGGR
jgi:[ribosomal protein S5]-alanine N-acetyltransferase